MDLFLLLVINLQENDDPLPDDELPEWKRDQPKIDLSQINPNDPESMLQATKKGKTIMMFASVSGNLAASILTEFTVSETIAYHNVHFIYNNYSNC